MTLSLGYDLPIVGFISFEIKTLDADKFTIIPELFVKYGSEEYQLETKSLNSYYITVNNEQVQITVRDGKYYAEGDVEVTLAPVLDKNNILSKGDDTRKDAETYTKLKQEYKDAVKKYNETLAKYLADKAKADEAVALWDAYDECRKAYEEKELGTLANLPKNIGDLFTGNLNIKSVDDIKVISDALVNIMKPIDTDVNGLDISKISTIVGDIKNKAEAAEVLNTYFGFNINFLEFVAAYCYDGQFKSLLDREIPILGSVKDIMKGLGVNTDAMTEYKHEYVVAWINAISTKVAAVKAGIALAQQTGVTVASGVEMIESCSELLDSSIIAAFETASTLYLEGTVGALEFTGDVLGLADAVLDKLSGKVGVLLEKTQAAYDEAEAAKKALDELDPSVSVEELGATKEALEAAQKRYNDLNTELEAAKAKLADAQKVFDDVKDEYDRLKAAEDARVIPAGGGYYSYSPSSTTVAEESAKEPATGSATGSEISGEIKVDENENTPLGEAKNLEFDLDEDATAQGAVAKTGTAPTVVFSMISLILVCAAFVMRKKLSANE